ncbi:MAG: prepilin-type N-terminal cleavage/methylation domain-containing protein [Clostridiales bacterium]|nr:prepilin-type N-terminal cleavage/methylation domain-containing protein [Clostridiales bacterium]
MKLNKKGFTLLEVLLAVAILLIASTMVMQGFMSTLSYSGNTAIYAQYGGKNTTTANAKIAANKDKIDAEGTSSPMDLSVSVSGSTKKVRVNTWKGTDSGTIVSGAYGEESGNTTENRYAVSYAMPDMKCSTCHKGDKLRRNQGDLAWYCTRCNKKI